MKSVIRMIVLSHSVSSVYIVGTTDKAIPYYNENSHPNECSYLPVQLYKIGIEHRSIRVWE